MDTQITPKTRGNRANTDLALIVDLALLRAEKLGVRVTAAFLADHGASFALTCRVLAEPGRRRASLDLLPSSG